MLPLFNRDYGQLFLCNSANTDPGAVAPFPSVVLIAVAFALVNFPSVSTWAGFGTALRGFLSDPVRLKWFNIAMGLLVAATLWPMIQ